MTPEQQRIYEMKAAIIQAAAHPIRLAILDFLGHEERCVCDIVDHVGAQRSNVSRHLALMLKAGVLSCRKEGQKVFYRVLTTCVLDFIGCLDQALHKRIVDETALLRRLQV